MHTLRPTSTFMKNRNILPAILLMLSAAACSPRPEIRLDFGSLGNDTLRIECMPFSRADDPTAHMSDTLLLGPDGRLDYTLPLREPCIVIVKPFATSQTIPGGRLWRGKMMLHLYAAPGDRISVTAETAEDRDTEFVISGNSLNRKIQVFNQRMSVFADSTEETARQMNRAYAEGDDAALDSLRSVLDGIRNGSIEFISDSFRQSVDSEEAPYIILLAPADSVEAYMAQLPARTLDGMFRPLLELTRKKAAEALLRKMAQARLTAGASAPDFSLSDIDGNDVTLSGLKGKTVLLDFWGTWCHACISGIPKLKQAAAKYADRLVVVSIGCKDDKEAWLAGVEKYGLDWINLREEGSMPSSEKPTVLYNVTAFPTKVVIGADGRIREIAVGEFPEFYDRLDRIMAAEQSSAAEE